MPPDGRTGREEPALLEPGTLARWSDLVRLVVERPGLHVPRGRLRPARGGGVHDEESGCVLPGLPVLALTPEAWWTGSVADWVARQVVHHLGSRHGTEAGPGESGTGEPGRADPARAGGTAVLRGREVGRGWDGELLLDEVEVVALVPAAAALEAQRHHRQVASGRWPQPHGDVDWIVLS